MWDLPGPGIEPMSPALAGGFLITRPPRKEKAMAPHSSTLAWKIPWTEEPGRLQSTGSWRVGHNWVTSLSLFTFMHWRGKWQPTPVFLPGESQGQRSLWAAVYGVAQSWARLKRLSSSSSSIRPPGKPPSITLSCSSLWGVAGGIMGPGCFQRSIRNSCGSCLGPAGKARYQPVCFFSWVL